MKLTSVLLRGGGGTACGEELTMGSFFLPAIQEILFDPFYCVTGFLRLLDSLAEPFKSKMFSFLLSSGPA
jgi:hypothetical protein